MTAKHPRYSARLIVYMIMGSVFMATRLSAQTPLPQPLPAGTKVIPPSPRDRAQVTWITVRPRPGDTQGQLSPLIKAEIRRATARGMTPFLEVGAEWCGPCKALEESLQTPEMIDAFSGAYVIHLDVDDWDVDKDFAPLGIHSNDGIPFIEGIDTTGHVTSQDDDEMDAVGIKHFVAAHLWHGAPK